jgi:membrane-bound serine protease (ClpP class)
MKIKALLWVSICLTAQFALADAPVVHFFLDGTIHGITAEYVTKALDFAEEQKAECVVFQIQTPGGVVESMRSMVSKMIASRVPVIVYVAPGGSRATSAGFYITVAADLAVMAPGTHLGSAHPVFGQEAPDNENSKIMMQKATEDSVAYIKTLTERRGRNVKEAERAVRDSVSFTENEALKLGLIDYVALDLTDLLKKADGRKIRRFDGSEIQLHLSSPRIVKFEMTRRQKFLSLLADPNIALILFGLGTLGLMIELYSPGLILPGIVGVISLALFFLSVQVLPINYAGLLLIIFAVVLFVLELKVTSYGLLTIGGVVSLALGATMLIDSPVPELQVSLKVITTIVAMVAVTMAFLLWLVVRLHRTSPVTGVQGLLQEIGTAQTDLDPGGQVFVHGEIWRAVAQQKIEKGEKVRVTGVDGLTLQVDRMKEKVAS